MARRSIVAHRGGGIRAPTPRFGRNSGPYVIPGSCDQSFFPGRNNFRVRDQGALGQIRGTNDISSLGDGVKEIELRVESIARGQTANPHHFRRGDADRAHGQVGQILEGLRLRNPIVEGQYEVLFTSVPLSLSDAAHDAAYQAITTAMRGVRYRPAHSMNTRRSRHQRRRAPGSDSGCSARRLSSPSVLRSHRRGRAEDRRAQFFEHATLHRVPELWREVAGAWLNRPGFLRELVN